MTIAVSEILKQAAVLSVEQQRELAMQLLEQAQRQAEMQPQTGHQDAKPDDEPLAPAAQVSAAEDEQEDDWLDTLDLKLMPPKRTYTMRVRYQFAGRMEPLPYDFDK
jgi:hypothetical protein